jgi:molybdate transport system substrate-binding protein
MNRSLSAWFAVMAAFAAATGEVRGAEAVRVLSAAAVQVPAEAIAQRFAAETGQQVVFEFATAGQVDARLRAGATPDIVITSSTRAAGIEPDRRQHHPLGTVHIGVAVRRGAPAPDLSSVESFTAGLERIATIAYGDPAGGATTGIHFAKVFAGLPFAGAAKPRIVLGANGLDVVQRVARGEADWGVTQVSEILHVDPALLAGPLPAPLQLETTYVALVRPGASTAARTFVDRLTGSAGAAQFRAGGFQ